MIKFCCYLCIVLIEQVFLIRAAELCYYSNQSSLVPINCEGNCCSIMSNSPQTACCNDLSWSTVAIPAFVIIGVCLLAICLVYFRPVLKFCLCGYKCPCSNRSRVMSPSSTSANDNPVYVMNNGDLPDYESVTKDSTPPPYNFVAAHPTDFHIETRILSAPPQYRSRCNSTMIVEAIVPVES